MASLENPVRFGLAGYGAWGQHHARAISAHPGARLKAVVAASEASRRKAQEDFPGVEAFSSVEEMVASGGLDVVDVVLPNHLHAQAADAALRAGCDVLLEKPMAASLSDCQRLIQLEEETGKALLIGHELRFSSQWGRIKALIAEGAIGTPRHVLVELFRRPYRQGADGWRYDPGRVGDWLLEEPVHFFDLARWYLAEHGDPVSIYAAANSHDSARPGLHDNVAAIVRHASGAQAVICQTLGAFGHHQTVKVTGTRGAVWASWSGVTDRSPVPVCSLYVSDEDGCRLLELTEPSGELHELAREIDHCVAMATRSARPFVSAHDGWWSVALCLAAGRSAETGAVVPLQSFVSTAIP